LELHTATKVGGRLVGCEEDYVVRLVEIGGSSTKGSELPKVEAPPPPSLPFTLTRCRGRMHSASSHSL
jgi:hypothetical protein